MYVLKQAIINALLANPNLAGTGSVSPAYVGANNIHPDYVTTIENPTFPCITISQQNGGMDGLHVGQNVSVKVDVWSMTGTDQLWDIFDEVNATLRVIPPQWPATFYLKTAAASAGVTVHFCKAGSITDNLYEGDTKLYHLSSYFNCVAR